MRWNEILREQIHIKPKLQHVQEYLFNSELRLSRRTLFEISIYNEKNAWLDANQPELDALEQLDDMEIAKIPMNKHLTSFLELFENKFDDLLKQTKRKHALYFAWLKEQFKWKTQKQHSPVVGYDIKTGFDFIWHEKEIS